ncbi:hypothetical protein ACH5RR_018552 [Cinchona calisaya]|uniref:Uncharacterized protein n=1 Tax=Cinchona calisaya TaxID=153742 RepID=A0ABD2ZN13_9GENT
MSSSQFSTSKCTTHFPDRMCECKMGKCLILVTRTATKNYGLHYYAFDMYGWCDMCANALDTVTADDSIQPIAMDAFHAEMHEDLCKLRVISVQSLQKLRI